MSDIRSQLREVQQQRIARQRKQESGGFEWTSAIGWMAATVLTVQLVRWITGLNSRSPQNFAETIVAGGLVLVFGLALVLLSIRNSVARKMIPRIAILIYLIRTIWVYRTLSGQ